MVLVYEYMASGSLADHLFKLIRDDENIPSLTWKQCLNICIGAGRGLDYLHTGVSILHRDVKASNILLDEDFTAKVADFGLAKPLLPSKKRQSQVCTKVKGTLGYLDPEYLLTGKLTRKSDTYAFGVVLLEVLCERRAIDRGYLKEEQILIKWALECISKGETERIVASNLKDEISGISLEAFVGVAERCLHNEPKKRPTMAEVVLQLQFVLHLQENSPYSKTHFNDVNLLDDETHSSSVKLGKASKDKNLLGPPSKVQSNDRLPVFGDENMRKPKNQFDNNVANFESPSGMEYQRKIRMPRLSRLWPCIDYLEPPSGMDYLPAASNEPLLPDKLRGPHVEAAVPKDKHTINMALIEKLKSKSVNSNSMSSIQTVKMQFVGVPAIPFDELKSRLYHFGRNSARYEDFYHGVLKSGQAAAIKVSMKIWLSYMVIQWMVLYGSWLMSCASNGLLHDILHGYKVVIGSESRPVLSWTKRVKFAVGAAKGLEYLHERDHVHTHFKSSNILIFNDAEVVKITDFHVPSPRGVLPVEDLRFCHPSHIDAGYLDARDYPRTNQSDVYNFGVVLRELLTGRKPFDAAALVEQWLLVRWVNLLNREYPQMGAAKMASVVALCLQNDASLRPNMNFIVKALESLSNAMVRPWAC